MGSIVNITCDIFSIEADKWVDTDCNAELVNSKIRFTTNKLGTYRLNAIELDGKSDSESVSSECDVSPAPYAIVCAWFGVMILLFVFTIMTRMNKPTLYTPVITNPQHTSRFSEIKLESERSPKSENLPPPLFVLQHPGSSVSGFFKQHILYDLFSSQAPIDTINHIGSFMSSMFFGYAVLGAFIYEYGNVDDNKNYSLGDVLNKFYPVDLQYVFIALGLVIPAALPLRVLAKTQLTRKFKIPAAVFSIVVLIGSIVASILMGVYFCQGASLRWTVAYLIYIPLELLISEFIAATILFMVRTR
jgi:hypothetical protein